jgi:uncharacterized protein YyaL (SSP411 family)
LFNDADARRRATYVVESLAPAIGRYPLAFGNILGCADMLINGAIEVAIVGDPASDDFRALERVVAERYVPSLVLAGGIPRSDDSIPLLSARDARDGRATAYVCRNYTCEEPATTRALLDEQLQHITVATVR